MINPYYENEYGKLYYGDCLDVLPQLNIKFDLLCTDPPYELTKHGNTGFFGGMFSTEESKYGIIFEHQSIDHDSWINVCYNKMKDNTHAYIMSNQSNFRKLCNISENQGFLYHKALIWDKGNKISGQFYMNSFEFIIFLRKGKAKPINNGGTADILSYKNIKTKDENGVNIHNSEKPIGLFETLIKNSSNENDIVLDPFCGSGTTGIACINTNRKFILIEKNEHYCELSAKRLDTVLKNKKFENLF